MFQDLNEGRWDCRDEHFLEFVLCVLVGVVLGEIGEVCPVGFRDHWSIGSCWMHWILAWKHGKTKFGLGESKVSGGSHQQGKETVLASSSGSLLGHGVRVELSVECS